MSTTASPSEADILARIIDPDAASLSPEFAQSILRLEFPQDDREQMSVLAEKARQGTLTTDEQTLIDCYERVGNFLSLLKSKARRSLEDVTDGS